MNRDTPYRVRIEEDYDHNPREYDCYDASDIAKFAAGDYRAWEYVIYRACPEHEGYSCEGAEVIDSSCAIGVLDDTDLEGDYTSPYLVDNDYIRSIIWEEWPTARVSPLVWQRRRLGLHYVADRPAINAMVTVQFRPFANPLRPWQLRDFRGITPCRTKPIHLFASYHRTLRSAKRHAANSSWHLEN
jgi:hypothetical protein